MTKETSSLARQRWLEDVVVECRKHLKACGFTCKDNVRISIGFPKGSHGGKKAIGQCWPFQASTDKFSEIFISPELKDSTAIIETTFHELVHHIAGCECGHKGAFKRIAEAIGFVAPMTSTPAGTAMKAACGVIIKKIGLYPAGALMVGERKKQTTRLLKCLCSECQYTVRTTRFWIEKAGPPICPTDDVSMTCETIDEEEGE